MGTAKHASMSEFAKGMVISEADVVVTGACFEMWDYGGKRSESTPAFHLTLKTTNGDVHEQFYSVGTANDYAPSKDGRALDILGDREKIHEQSNFAMFMNAFFKAGFPITRMNNDDIGCVVGTQGHVKQEAVKRTGGNVKAETSLLVFDKITGLPGESKSGGSSAGASAGGDDIAQEATQLMLEILSEAGTIERKALLPKVIKSDTYKTMDKNTKTAVLNLIKTDEFVLGGADWSVKDGVVTLGS